MLSRWSRMEGLVRGHRRRLFLLLVRGRHLSRVFFLEMPILRRKEGDLVRQLEEDRAKKVL
jgi:hypothetical protein